MDIKKKKIVKIVLIIILLIIMLLLWGIFFGGKSFSKYKKDVNSSSLTEVAKPVFVVEGADDIKIDGREDTIYNFSVKNYDEKGKSEVDLDYTINIENNSKADLEFVLTKDGKRVLLSNNKSNKTTLSSNEKQSDDYALQIKYHNSPAVVQDIDGNVQVKVEAVQAEK